MKAKSARTKNFSRLSNEELGRPATHAVRTLAPPGYCSAPEDKEGVIHLRFGEGMGASKTSSQKGKRI